MWAALRAEGARRGHRQGVECRRGRDRNGRPAARGGRSSPPLARLRPSPMCLQPGVLMLDDVDGSYSTARRGRSGADAVEARGSAAGWQSTPWSGGRNTLLRSPPSDVPSVAQRAQAAAAQSPARDRQLAFRRAGSSGPSEHAVTPVSSSLLGPTSPACRAGLVVPQGHGRRAFRLLQWALWSGAEWDRRNSREEALHLLCLLRAKGHALQTGTIIVFT